MFTEIYERAIGVAVATGCFVLLMWLVTRIAQWHTDRNTRGMVRKSELPEPPEGCKGDCHCPCGKEKK